MFWAEALFLIYMPTLGFISASYFFAPNKSLKGSQWPVHLRFLDFREALFYNQMSVSEPKPTDLRLGNLSAFDPNVWTGCVSQEGICTVSEVADMYPACLVSTRAVALMGIRTRHWSH
jgi:hypothetical protein